ncbi:MAG: T9SS type A sorting domain-containing protein [Bacteroidota bacterium]|nr:T9SS type A sorting domain-containing protein [Bacteroidota bacterium]
MNKIFLLILFITSAQLFAQKNIQLNINHKLGSSAFALEQVGYNNFGNNFKVSRMAYYISNIKIVHDTGKITNISNVYVLIDASAATSIDLGSRNIDSVEKIQFSIGVNAPVNNQDPSQWPESHALSPKSPSMHWGWASGYRFVAMEGKCGDGLNQIFELHGLGNGNYYQTEVITGGVKMGNNINITIDANYTEALKNINMWQGVISHGETDEAQKILRNMRDFVFRAVGNTANLNTTASFNPFQIVPNPSIGQFKIIHDSNLSTIKSIEVFDMSGKNILSLTDAESLNHEIFIQEKGLYLVKILDVNNSSYFQKLIVQ